MASRDSVRGKSFMGQLFPGWVWAARTLGAPWYTCLPLLFLPFRDLVGEYDKRPKKAFVFSFPLVGASATKWACRTLKVPVRQILRTLLVTVLQKRISF